MQVGNAAHTGTIWKRLVDFREGWYSREVPAPERWVLRLLSRLPYIHSRWGLPRSSKSIETLAMGLTSKFWSNTNFQQLP